MLGAADQRAKLKNYQSERGTGAIMPTATIWFSEQARITYELMGEGATRATAVSLAEQIMDKGFAATVAANGGAIVNGEVVSQASVVANQIVAQANADLSTMADDSMRQIGVDTTQSDGGDFNTSVNASPSSPASPSTQSGSITGDLFSSGLHTGEFLNANESINRDGARPDFWAGISPADAGRAAGTAFDNNRYTPTTQDLFMATANNFSQMGIGGAPMAMVRGGGVMTAMVATGFAGRAVVAAAPVLAKNLHVDGPQRGSRIAQLRYGNTPLVRLDYGKYEGSGGEPRLHLNFGPGKDNFHLSIDPRSWFDDGRRSP